MGSNNLTTQDTGYLQSLLTSIEVEFPNTSIAVLKGTASETSTTGRTRVSRYFIAVDEIMETGSTWDETLSRVISKLSDISK